MLYGMATMTHRTTFALDGSSILRLKKLASLWETSQAGVVRRSLEIAEQSSSQEPTIERRLNAAQQLRKRMKTRTIDVEAWIRDARKSRR